MSDQVQTSFMTGATGLLGQYALRELLARGRRVVALLRPPLDGSTDRLRQQIQRIGVEFDAEIEAGRLIVVEGALPDALPDPTWGQTDDIISCAASLQLFANGNGEPHRTNIDGTQALIDWADKHGVTCIHGVSSAYVCGLYADDAIAETFHDPKPRFRTEYEETKWRAESLLSEWGSRDGNTLTVFRPSFIVGDSVTGHTTQFFGFYQLARLVSCLKEQFDGHNGDTQIPLRIPLRADHRPNLVPVDFAARIMAEVIVQPEWHGRVYHLTDPDPISNGQFKRWFEELYGLSGGYFVDPDDPMANESPAESLLWDRMETVAPRLTHDPRFVQQNTRAVMDAADIEFPAMSRERVTLLLDFAARQDWGMREQREQRRQRRQRRRAARAAQA